MSSSPAVLLFDGTCTLCNGVVQFVIRRDARGHFQFAALQSEVGQALLAAHGLVTSTIPDSVVLLEDGRAYLHSEAVLRVAGQLGWPWRALAVGRLLPRPWRDALYRYVARNRYRWFGQQTTCWLPTPALQQRLLR